MPLKQRYGDRYKAGDTPWDVGRPDFNLIEVVTGHPVPPCKALDVGCGTGDNTIWLAVHGFSAIGTDFTEMAIDQARKKSRGRRRGLPVPGRETSWNPRSRAGPLTSCSTAGLFHSFRSADDRATFVGARG